MAAWRARERSRSISRNRTDRTPAPCGASSAASMPGGRRERAAVRAAGDVRRTSPAISELTAIACENGQGAATQPPPTMTPPPRDAWVPPGCADLTNPDVFLDGPPHGTFRRLRAEAPVAWHPEAGGGGFWCVTRWQDVRTVSLDQRTFSSWRGGIMLREFPDDLLAAQRETITAMEPARHAAHRKIVSSAFVPKVIRDLEPRLRTVTREILDGLGARGTCDFVTDVASELPVVAICELLGIPHADRGKVVAWSNALVGMDDPEYAGTPEDGPVAAMQVTMYARALAEERRREPRSDVISRLLAAELDG